MPSCAAPCRSLLRSKGKTRATFPPGEYATTFLRTTAQSTLSIRATVDELVKRALHTSEGVLTDLRRPNPCPRFIKNPQPARDLFAVEQIAGGFGDAMHQSHGLLVKLENNYTRSGAGRMPTDVSKIKVECDEHSALRGRYAQHSIIVGGWQPRLSSQLYAVRGTMRSRARSAA